MKLGENIIGLKDFERFGFERSPVGGSVTKGGLRNYLRLGLKDPGASNTSEKIKKSIQVVETSQNNKSTHGETNPSCGKIRQQYDP